MNDRFILKLPLAYCQWFTAHRGTSATRRRHAPWLLSWYGGLTLCWLVSSQGVLAAGGIATDGSLSAAKTFTGDSIIISTADSPKGLYGKNLFHSFSEFNINRGQTVTFSEESPGALDNIIARVTGRDSSSIDGRLQVTPGGQANFYLLNPNGVFIGENASIEIPGVFHVGAADILKFSDGSQMQADVNSSSFSAATPTSFGFLANAAQNNSLIAINGAKLGESEKIEGMKLYSGNIKIDNSEINPSKNISINASNDISINESKFLIRPPVDSKISSNLVFDGNNIDIKKSKIEFEPGVSSGNAQIVAKDMLTIEDTKVLALGDNGAPAGKISLISNNITITGLDSEINAANKSITKSDESNATPAEITITARDKLNLEMARIEGSTKGVYDAANIIINANELNFKGGNVNSETVLTDELAVDSLKSGNAGNIGINFVKAFNLLSSSRISTTSLTDTTIPGSKPGIPGNIKITSSTQNSKINLDRSTLVSEFITPYTEALDNSSKIEIIDVGDIRINQSNITTTAFHVFGGSINNASKQNSGSIKISGSYSLIADNLKISSESADNKSGNIDISSFNKIQLNNSNILTSTKNGQAGSISLKADNEILLGHGSIIKTSRESESELANANNISAGNIKISSNLLKLDSGNILADNSGTGKAGTLDFNGVDFLLPIGFVVNHQPYYSGSEFFSSFKETKESQNDNIISAFNQNGVSGLTKLNPLQLNLSGVLASLGTPQFTNDLLLQDFCAIGADSSLTVEGHGALPATSEDLLLQ